MAESFGTKYSSDVREGALPISEKEVGKGHCLEDALREAGYDPGHIDEWPFTDQMREVAERLGLKVHDFGSTKGELEISGGVPMIVIYTTRDKRAHAKFVNDFGDVANKGHNFIGVIELPSK